MSPSEATNRATRKEWRELGFYYDYEKETKRWRIVGSKAGLLRFRDCLLRYADNPKNAKLSEHEHFGPYMFLEVMTAKRPGIDDHSIHGSLEDLKRLAHILENKLQNAAPGTAVRIDKEYSPDSKASLLVEIQEDGFDPASADKILPPET